MTATLTAASATRTARTGSLVNGGLATAAIVVPAVARRLSA